MKGKLNTFFEDVSSDLKKLGHNNTFLLLSVTLLIGGCLAGYLSTRNFFERKCDRSNFHFINKQLVCEEKFVIDKRSYRQLGNRLRELIAKKAETGEAESVSIYFRDLQYGPTLGINEHERFAPASLLKLPLLLTYLIYSEGTPDFLGTNIVVEPLEENLKQAILPKRTIEPNAEYSISEMLTYMIKYSDNGSYYTLLSYLNKISPDKDLLNETFVDLGILDPQTFEDETISVKAYSSIFVQLYHASFLQNKALSEKALSFLTDTDFVDGIVAGVPSDVEVAHKFGEREGFDNETKQLHDCGIVYYPENPYMLCVMTRGQDLNKLSETIATISKMFYEEFDSRKL